VASAAEHQHTSPARGCAYTVIRRVFEQGAYADRALHAEAGDLEPRDRALAMQLAYGTVQRKRTLDHILGRLSSRPPERLDQPVLAALRLGLFQLAFLDGIAEHAAVNESVELAKLHAHGGAGLVNAVLRRAARERSELLADLEDSTPQAAAVLYSVPDWLAEMWWRELGEDEARELLREINRPPESALSHQHAEGRPGAAGALAHRSSLARGPGPGRGLRPVRLPALGAGPSDATVARLDACGPLTGPTGR